MVKGQPTWWLILLPLLHCVGFGEAQNEEEKHEPVFCVRYDTSRTLREPSQKSRSTRDDRKEMEAFGGCLADTAVASTLPSHEPPDSEVQGTQSKYECICDLEN